MADLGCGPPLSAPARSALADGVNEKKTNRGEGKLKGEREAERENEKGNAKGWGEGAQRLSPLLNMATLQPSQTKTDRTSSAITQTRTTRQLWGYRPPERFASGGPASEAGRGVRCCGYRRGRRAEA